MRKIVAFIVQTVDGYYEGPNGEFDWPNVDAEFNVVLDPAHRGCSTCSMFGRNTYEGMAAVLDLHRGHAYADPDIMCAS